ncbi:MAG: NAD(P)-dependent oxidoreductase [Bacteroidota bacterium]
MKILVTGSSGHLGEALMRLLKKSNQSAYGLDILPGPFTTHQGSITDKNLVDLLVKEVDVIIHTATLHKPHVATHSKQDFLDVNVTGTLTLLEAARKYQLKSFIFTSTTSTFGDTMKPQLHEPAVWITEEVRAISKNIYGVSKLAAEDLCWLFHRNHQLPCLILRTSRFFLEEDDNRGTRDLYVDDNIKVNEFLYRRVDVEDAAIAHLLAVEKAKEIGFSKYIISTTSPFQKKDLALLHQDAPAVIKSYFPGYEKIYQEKGWKMQPRLGRVYVNDKARKDLGWEPKFDFRYVLEQIQQGKGFKSDLAMTIGSKLYHDEVFEDGPYPVEE